MKIVIIMITPIGIMIVEIIVRLRKVILVKLMIVMIRLALRGKKVVWIKTVMIMIMKMIVKSGRIILVIHDISFKIMTSYIVIVTC